MKFINGFLYKLKALSQEDQDTILSFLNNQHNATQSMHFILLNHIKKYGTGDLNHDIKAAMLQELQEQQNTNVNDTVNLGLTKQPQPAPQSETNYPIQVEEKVELVDTQKETVEKISNNNDNEVDLNSF